MISWFYQVHINLRKVTPNQHMSYLFLDLIGFDKNWLPYLDFSVILQVLFNDYTLQTMIHQCIYLVIVLNK